jgi:tRNA pseudouridine38-40 synthase
MTRYFVHLAYKGTNYHGWQYQPNAITVQETLNKAFSLLLSEEINLTGAGRTDTGVHARNFFAHFDSNHSDLQHNNQIVYKLNCFLPDDIQIFGLYKMDHNAHARFDATEREYKYYISRTKNIFSSDYCWQFYPELDIAEMNIAASTLLQYTDFTSFSKLHTDVMTNNCKVSEAKWNVEDNLLVFKIIADRFLRNMVRSLVGTLIEVGNGKRATNDFEKLILTKDRTKAGPSVPAKGLFLENIRYPYSII